MASFTKIPLSGSTNGRLIEVVATATPGTLIHTAGVTDLDEVYLYAENKTGADVTLTVEWGGVLAADLIQTKVKKLDTGLILVIPGGIITGGLIVRAFSPVASEIRIMGWVNRIG